MNTKPMATLAELELRAASVARTACRNGDARRLRESMHLGVREVARALDVSPTAVSQWERAQRSPRGDRAVAYAELLGLMNEVTTS